MALHFASQQLPVLVHLEGECNKCGLCCAAKKDGQWLFCTNLLVSSIGMEGGTRCLVYERRYDGMPIIMANVTGTIRVHALCHKDSPEETAKIVQEGIGKGCSLRIKREA